LSALPFGSGNRLCNPRMPKMGVLITSPAHRMHGRAAERFRDRFGGESSIRDLGPMAGREAMSGRNILMTCQFDYQPGNAKSTSLFATTATCRNLLQPRTNATSTPPTSWSISKQHPLASVTPPFRILCI
jgi:hypothetical protein